jgi:hypothetical protein
MMLVLAIYSKFFILETSLTNILNTRSTNFLRNLVSLQKTHEYKKNRNNSRTNQLYIFMEATVHGIMQLCCFV